MAPQDEVIIESANADDYETIYGESHNDSMSAGVDSIGRPTPGPYLRLDSLLRNLTRNEGDTVRLRCAAIGSPLPIQFAWFKNNAPLEIGRKKNRIRVKNRDYQSRLLIRELEVLDSGYYRCEASNEVGSVDTTGVLKVRPKSRTRPAPIGVASGSTMFGGGRDDEDTLGPSESSHALLQQLDNGDWLFAASVDGRSRRLRNNTCVPYGGSACAQYFHGLSVLVVSPDMEQMMDIERNVIATNIYIDKHPSISVTCRGLSQRVGCFHRYHVCEPTNHKPSSSSSSSSFASSTHPSVMRICARDCRRMENELCRNEYELAKAHDLVGDHRDALLPDCDDLEQDEHESSNTLVSNEKCVPVIDPHFSLTTSERPSTPPPFDQLPISPTERSTAPSDNFEQVDATHFCYVGNGCAYRGRAATTKSGKMCRTWSSATAGNRIFESDSIRLVEHNFCRNPDNRPQPWCFTSGGSEEPCDVRPCPSGLFPTLPTCERGTTNDKTNGKPSNNDSTSDGPKFVSSISDFWHSLPTHWQYAALGGVVGLVLLALLLLCCCFCAKRNRRKREKKKRQMTNEAAAMKNGSVNGSVMNSTGNGYYRKINGSAHSGSGGGNSGGVPPLELSALLPPPPTTPPPPPAFNAVYAVGEIDGERLTFVEPLGEGQFGKVWKGELQANGIDDEPVQVAIKTLKDDANAAHLLADFEQEVQFAAGLQHPNLVRLLGICNNVRPKCAVFEYMIHGDLHEFLLLRSPYSLNEGESVNMMDRDRLVLDQTDFLHIATQIASGMEYLASCHYVHRDLATRNCLVTDRLTIKIADFGLMRDIYAADYYRMQTRTMLPVRWMPAEAIIYGQFSEQSDVWAYGVALWEIYSYGAQPYFGYTNEQCIELVRNRCLLECPHNCPPRMYSVMVECWHEVPGRRPRFAELHGRITSWSISSPAQSSTALSHLHNTHLPRPSSVNSGATSSTAAAGHRNGGSGGASHHSGSHHHHHPGHHGPPPQAPYPTPRDPPTLRSYTNLLPPSTAVPPPPSYAAAISNNNNNNNVNTASPLLTNGKLRGSGNLIPGNGDSPRGSSTNVPQQGRQLQPLRATGYPDFDTDSSDG